MEAMSYEYLIRRVHNCGRTIKNGADASLYRTMEQAFYNIETKTLFETQADREYEYRKAFSAVRRNVDDALIIGIKKLQHKAVKDDLDELQSMSDQLDFEFYKKEKLDTILKRANSIFHQYGLEIG